MKLRYLLLTLFPLSLFAQENSDEWMQPDRPGMATGTSVMPFKAVMWETGFQGDWIEGHAITLPTTMFRFGITNFAELRLEYDGALFETEPKHFEYEVSPLILGTKVRIFDGSEEHKWIPQVALMTNLAITPSLNAMAQSISATPLPVITSSSAGLYVCNRVYYEALHLNQKALFIHIPKNMDMDLAARVLSFLVQNLHT